MITSDNWSGDVISAASGHSFSKVSAEWTIPQVSQVPGQSLTAISEWVGIDGYLSNDVCQAGVFEAVSTVNGNSTVTCSAWDEWYPLGSNTLPVAVKPGDIVQVTVSTSGKGANTAQITFDDVSTKKSFSTALVAPRGTTLAGNCADFVVETPEVSSNGRISQPLACDFTPVVFSSTLAAYSNGQDVSDTSGNVFAVGSPNISGSSWTEEAVGSILGPNQVDVQFVPWWS